jgi:hypothetical protein
MLEEYSEIMLDSFKEDDTIYIMDPSRDSDDYRKTQIVSLDGDKYKLKVHFFEHEKDTPESEDYEITKNKLKELYPRDINGKLIKTGRLSEQNDEHYIYDIVKFPNVLLVDIEDIKPGREDFPRKINDRNKEIVLSPISIYPNGIINDGNNRYEYCVRKGYTKIPVLNN